MTSLQVYLFLEQLSIETKSSRDFEALQDVMDIVFYELSEDDRRHLNCRDDKDFLSHE